MEAERYDRQQRIAGWNQSALGAARVIIAGAGALGNEVIKNLALMGVGHILIVDFDRVELSNLSRTALFLERDVGRAKAEVAAERASMLNSEIEVRYINGDLLSDIGLGFYRHADLVVGALDNLAARSAVGLSCSLSGVPFLDGGMWAWGGEVRWFKGGEETCFECTLGEGDREHALERRSCTGFRENDTGGRLVPTTISTSAIIGGLLSQEAARYLCGWEIQGGEALVYNGLKMALHRSTLPLSTQCPYHEPYAGVKELRTSAAREITALEILRRAEAEFAASDCSLELGRDFLLGFNCSGCGAHEEVNALLSRLDESASDCPRCARPRRPEIISSLGSDHPLATRSLDGLGVPPGEVLAVRAADKLCLYELTGDVVALWR